MPWKETSLAMLYEPAGAAAEVGVPCGRCARSEGGASTRQRMASNLRDCGDRVIAVTFRVRACESNPDIRIEAQWLGAEKQCLRVAARLSSRGNRSPVPEGGPGLSETK